MQLLILANFLSVVLLRISGAATWSKHGNCPVKCIFRVFPFIETIPPWHETEERCDGGKIAAGRYGVRGHPNTSGFPAQDDHQGSGGHSRDEKCVF